LDTKHMGEHERELWDLVESRLGLKLSKTRIPTPSKNLAMRWCRYSRRRGVIPAVKATRDYLRRRIMGSI
jgi:hypothetical protein